MSTRRKIRLPFALRVFVLALFALSMMLQPVVASMGEIHEFAHDPGGHRGHAEPVGATADEPAEKGASGTLHALLHLAHCCGQCPAMVASALAMPLPVSAVVSAATREPQAHPELRRLAPFRPPTTA